MIDSNGNDPTANPISADIQLDWAEQIRKGNEEYFELLFLTYYKPLTRFANRFLKSQPSAEETVQEVFLRIWDQRAEWFPDRSVRAYLYRAVRNKALDEVKNRKVRETYDAEISEEWHQEPEIIGYHEENPELIKLVNHYIDHLPERCRYIFKLHRYDGLTYNEIAEVLNISRNTVEVQMTRSLKKLRTWLLPYLSVVLYLIG